MKKILSQKEPKKSLLSKFASKRGRKIGALLASSHKIFTVAKQPKFHIRDRTVRRDHPDAEQAKILFE